MCNYEYEEHGGSRENSERRRERETSRDRGALRRRQSMSGERWEGHNKRAWGLFGMLIAGLELP